MAPFMVLGHLCCDGTVHNSHMAKPSYSRKAVLWVYPSERRILASVACRNTHCQISIKVCRNRHRNTLKWSVIGMPINRALPSSPAQSKRTRNKPENRPQRLNRLLIFPSMQWNRCSEGNSRLSCEQLDDYKPTTYPWYDNSPAWLKHFAKSM